MAQYFTAFSSGTLDDFGGEVGGFRVVPSEHALAPSGFVLEPIFSNRVMTWNVPGDILGDCEVKALVRLPPDRQPIGPALRAGGIGNARRALFGCSQFYGDDYVIAGSLQGASSAVDGTWNPVDLGDYCWISIQEISNIRTAFAFDYATHDVIDSFVLYQAPSPSFRGVGVVSFAVGSLCLALSVGTDGDPAPIGPISAKRSAHPLLLPPF